MTPPTSICLRMLQSINLPTAQKLKMIHTAHLPSISHCFSTRHMHSLSYVAVVRLSTMVIFVKLLSIVVALDIDYFILHIGEITKH